MGVRDLSLCLTLLSIAPCVSSTYHKLLKLFVRSPLSLEAVAADAPGVCCMWVGVGERDVESKGGVKLRCLIVHPESTAALTPNEPPDP